MQRKATRFEFTSYEFQPEKKQVFFHYATHFDQGEPLTFTETILLPKEPVLDTVQKELLQKILEGTHIMLGISYYKYYCATNIIIPYALSKIEADFFTTVYKKGLGEFFYKNNLNPNISPKFPYDKKIKPVSYPLKKSGRHLVGIGGGKDSIVSAELLKSQGFDITAFYTKTGADSTIINSVIDILGVNDLRLERKLDPKVHEKHLYNGHVPVSAILAFLGSLTCILYNYASLIVSNEYSSNFGNITYKSLSVNHQWSKSFEFEQLFQNYLHTVISSDITYFSLLRRFYELRIVKLFSNYPQYFPVFSSCNRNFTIKEKGITTLWCNQCAKCVFVFTLLSAFLPKKELLEIFGKNLYQEASLLPMFKDIFGLGTMKPFDCVGTFDEAKVAFLLAGKKFKTDYIIKTLSAKVRVNQKTITEVLSAKPENTIPEEYKLLGLENTAIVGYGKEGEVTKKYLKQCYPKLKVGILNAKQGKDYLRKQKDFELAIKTPGINKKFITIPYTTATNIFFSKVSGKNMIIGVTGSKGKSTTSSLIYHILKTAGKDVELLGNIGNAMLAAILKPVPKERIFVLELSSYQLDDIAFSPDIAVVTNLFPEHMDFHGNLKNYYEAKKNIIRYQSPDQYFVYNTKTASWLKNYSGKPISFSTKQFESNLLGEHNQQNIGAAVAVTEILQIPQETISQAVKSFTGLKHRLEKVGEFKGITFYDDAISTTPESTIMAIKALKNVDTIFLGGQDRGYNFSDLEKTIKKYNIKNAVLFPDSGNKIKLPGVKILKTKSMQKAVEFAYKYTTPRSICLLSCASPSYSLWKNFEEKGDQFQTMVKKLAKIK